MRPSRTANEVFLYVLAVAAQRYGVQVHAYCVLSNHYHLVVTDPDARLPIFQQFLDAFVGRALNAWLGRDEAFWGSKGYSAVQLVAPADIVDKAAYTLANPVAAGLVRSARQWPGLWSSPDAVEAEELHVRRPRHFFDPNGNLPKSVMLRLTTPPGFLTAEAFREQLAAALADREAGAVQTASGFLGVKRVLAQQPTDRPRSVEPRGRPSPRVAARDKWKRIEALGRLVSFLTSYRTALRERREGKQDVLFPAGTYLLRVAHGVACTGAG